MPLVYTKEEIIAYLINRGFDVSNEEVINKFIHDLKKMIKYENRQRRRQKLGHDAEETKYTTDQLSQLSQPQQSNSRLFLEKTKTKNITSEYDELMGESDECDDDDVESVLDPKKAMQHEIENRQRQRQKPGHDAEKSKYNKTDQHSSKLLRQQQSRKSGKNLLQGNKENLKSGPEKRLCPCDAVDSDLKKLAQYEKENRQRQQQKLGHNAEKSKYNTTRQHSKQSRPQKARNDKLLLQNQEDEDTLSELSTVLGADDGEAESSETEIYSVSETSTRNTGSGPSDSVKRDPVALYHYYKKIWDKQNIPGQTHHMQLRWRVRAETVGNYPCVNGQPIKYLR